MFNSNSYVEINLLQLKKNIKFLRSHFKKKLFCFVIKANAYGMGLVKVASFAEKQKIDYLAVNDILEGILLRKNDIKLPICILGAFFKEQIEDIIKYDLEFTISSLIQAKQILKYLKKNKKKCKVHLKVDTGLHRLGVLLNEAKELYNFLINEESFKLISIFTHLAFTEFKNHPTNDIQIKRFNGFINDIKPNKSIICHVANSKYLCNYEKNIKDMIRTGSLFMGVAPLHLLDKFKNIKSIFSLKSRVIFIKKVKKNENIGYRHTYKTKKNTSIAIIPIGYADGYSRVLSNKGEVLIKGKRYHIIGNICMNQLMVDISNDPINIGDEVVLIGKQKGNEITLQEISGKCSTVNEDILCAFSERLKKVYIE